MEREEIFLGFVLGNDDRLASSGWLPLSLCLYQVNLNAI